MFLSNGVLKYFPLEGVERDRGWLILQCDSDLSLYYCWLIKKHLGLELQQSMHKSHISIVRGEVIKYRGKWNYYQESILHFHYSNTLGTNGKHWWLNVYSPCFVSIRHELGLDSQPEYDFHLTVGVLS